MKKLFFLIALVLICSFGFYYLNGPVRTIEVFSNFPVYETVEELWENADLVVVGSTNSSFYQREHKITYYNDGSIQDFYSITKFNVQEVLKAPEGFNVPEEIEIIEPASIMKSLPIRTVLIASDYQVLNKDSIYLIFLKRNTFGGLTILSGELGKYNIDGTDKNEEKSITALKQKIKQDVLKLVSSKPQ